MAAPMPSRRRCGPQCRRPSPAQAHCTVCHATFGGVVGFDRHRRGGVCLDPARLGMVNRDGIWREELTEAARDRLRGRATDGGSSQ